VNTPTGSSTAPPAVGSVQQIQNHGPQGTGRATQAKSARALAKQYDAAAAMVAGLLSAKVTGSLEARLVTALRQTAKAYRRADTAASAGDVAGYVAALSQVDAGKKAVNAALVDMGAPAPQSPQSTQPGSTQQPQSAGPCSGDSASDDPSDDSCNP
jgi:hypothetical protein